MNINASIIDQRLGSLIDDIRQPAKDELNIQDENKLKPLSFVYLCVKTILDLDHSETLDCLTEGGGDFGVDAIHISEEHDGEFTVSLFQAKYKNNFKGDANFSESDIEALINAIRHLFDPNATLQQINPRLLSKVEAARSLIRDGYIPQVRALACNNGQPWNVAAAEAIERTGFGGQVTWEHVNHDRLINILQATKPVNDTLRLSGKAIVEDMDFSRVLVGKIAITEIADLIDRHGERLLERNIRRYLGLQRNRVNEGIRNTLINGEGKNFYFYNNGITLTCDSFTHNAFQQGDYQVKVENLQIINGGQTCLTIAKTLAQPSLFPQEAYVLIRLYQLPKENEDLVKNITYATNSQNPVDLKDLKANDERQQRLELDIQTLGFSYRRKRSESYSRSDITSGVAAEAVLSVWRKKPHQAKFFSRKHFGKLYDSIFTDQLNGSQVITAVLLYRIAENRRKRPAKDDPDFVRYASCFAAMQMGQKLLSEMNLNLEGLNHQYFPQAQELIKMRGDDYFKAAIDDIQVALRDLYGDRPISLQQLAATFRRGDLIEKLR
ncbi:MULTISPECIES: AIPR family protein [Cyanophyceae]|uniref:AIPR family protein n=1 Tax=Cyanophyceae TaxID=3028117 RepID=UPI00016DCE66|nr:MULTISPECIES: AIPR family protein [Cyanophyceae]ACB00934.1 conserved hypothetical protein [Picosynechococcus sp. PCC 7002]SMH58657.1 AIPR protein [Picosynechococcus sp. OG1]SMQ86370.1 AIPR protein [Synechococcus sp. 7002]